MVDPLMTGGEEPLGRPGFAEMLKFTFEYIKIQTIIHFNTLQFVGTEILKL